MIFVEVPHSLRFDPKFDLSLPVFLRFVYLSVSKISDNSEVVLVNFLRDPDVRFCSSEV